MKKEMKTVSDFLRRVVRIIISSIVIFFSLAALVINSIYLYGQQPNGWIYSFGGVLIILFVLSIGVLACAVLMSSLATQYETLALLREYLLEEAGEKGKSTKEIIFPKKPTFYAWLEKQLKLTTV